jgi:uncharacterized protein (DUF2062 family)
MAFKERFQEEIKKIVALEDRPHAVALGVAIGILFGVTPLFGVKMPLAVALAFIARGNIIATLVVVGLADICTPALAVVYFIEYKLGCLIFNLGSHLASWDLIDESDMMPSWIRVMKKGLPILVGSLALGVVAAVPAYGVVKYLLEKIHSKKSDKTTSGGADDAKTGKT